MNKIKFSYLVHNIKIVSNIWHKYEKYENMKTRDPIISLFFMMATMSHDISRNHLMHSFYKNLQRLFQTVIHSSKFRNHYILPKFKQKTNKDGTSNREYQSNK